MWLLALVFVSAFATTPSAPASPRGRRTNPPIIWPTYPEGSAYRGTYPSPTPTPTSGSAGTRTQSTITEPKGAYSTNPAPLATYYESSGEPVDVDPESVPREITFEPASKPPTPRPTASR